MNVKVQVLEKGVPISENMLTMDNDYLFNVPGGVVDIESGRRLLGYSLKGIWAKQPRVCPPTEPSPWVKEKDTIPWLTDTTRREPTAGQEDVTRAINDLTNSIDELILLLKNRAI